MRARTFLIACAIVAVGVPIAIVVVPGVGTVFEAILIGFLASLA